MQEIPPKWVDEYKAALHDAFIAGYCYGITNGDWRAASHEIPESGKMMLVIYNARDLNSGKVFYKYGFAIYDFTTEEWYEPDTGVHLDVVCLMPLPDMPEELKCNHEN